MEMSPNSRQLKKNITVTTTSEKKIVRGTYSVFITLNISLFTAGNHTLAPQHPDYFHPSKMSMN